MLAIEFVRLQFLLSHIFFLFGVGLDVNSKELFEPLIIFYLSVDDCLVACVLLRSGDTVVIIKDEEDITLEVDTHSIVMSRRSVFLLWMFGVKNHIYVFFLLVLLVFDDRVGLQLFSRHEV